MWRRLLDERGVNLVEVSVVVAVAAIIMAIAVPSFNKTSDDADDALTRQKLETALDVAREYFAGRLNYQVEALSGERVSRSGTYEGFNSAKAQELRADVDWANGDVAASASPTTVYIVKAQGVELTLCAKNEDRVYCIREDAASARPRYGVGVSQQAALQNANSPYPCYLNFDRASAYDKTGECGGGDD